MSDKIMCRKCKQCNKYARLSGNALCQDCDDFKVRFKVRNVTTNKTVYQETMDMFYKDYENRFREVKKYVMLETPSWSTVIKGDDFRNKQDSTMIVLQVDEDDYSSFRRRNNFTAAYGGVQEKCERLLRGLETY